MGDISSEHFSETINVEATNQLLIVPVTIKGNTYRFLFDTGAPFSVSEELQNKFQFNMLNKATLTDSDKSRSSVEIIEVDTINIGKIAFTNQTAFVANFKQNAIIKCLNIDGIIGSNLMKHCNWTIDMQNEFITLYKGYKLTDQDTFVTIPFSKNTQYDIILDVKVGKTTVSNIKIDYGSNGSLTLPEKRFSVLRSKEFDKTRTSIGFVQSGLFGVRKPFTSELAQIDSLWLNEVLITNATIKSGKSALLGGKILTNYIVNINWDNKTIAFAKHTKQYQFTDTFGFKIGVTANKLVIQSVLEQTPAFNYGLKADMEIISIDDLNFTTAHTLCDYMNYFKQERKSIQVVYKTLNGAQKEITLTKKSPF